MKNAFTLSICLLVWGCKLVEKLRFDPSNLKSLIQNRSVNRGSRLLAIVRGTPQYLMTSLTNSLATSSARQSFVTGTNIAYLLTKKKNISYLENRSTTTTKVQHPSNLGKFTIKSMETLSYGHFRTGSGSRSPNGECYSILSRWHTRHVFTYISTVVPHVRLVVLVLNEHHSTVDPRMSRPFGIVVLSQHFLP